MNDSFDVRPSEPPRQPEGDGAAQRYADHVVESPPPGAEEVVGDDRQYLARDRHQDDLERMEDHECDRTPGPETKEKRPQFPRVREEEEVSPDGHCQEGDREDGHGRVHHEPPATPSRRERPEIADSPDECVRELPGERTCRISVRSCILTESETTLPSPPHFEESERDCVPRSQDEVVPSGPQVRFTASFL